MATLNDANIAKDKFARFKGKPFRANQGETIIDTVNSNKSVVAVCASTGAGKSLLGACVSSIYDDSIYVVHSKNLQDQIESDFPEFKILKGRSNYPCLQVLDSGCDCCPYNEPKKACPDYDDCPYAVQKSRVIAHPLRVLNYSYMLTEWNYVGKMSKLANVVVCDEADTLEGEMLKFVGINISENDINRFNLPRPRYLTAEAKEGVNSWKEWGTRCADILNFELKRLPKDVTKKEKDKLTNLHKKFTIFTGIVDETWICDIGDNRWGKYISFQPTWITEDLCNMYVRSHIKDINSDVTGKLVLMSATLLPPRALAYTLGIPEAEMNYLKVPYTFDPKNRPILFTSTARLSKESGAKEYDKIKAKIQEYLKRFEGKKGLIHSNSYTLNDVVMSIGDKRLITHGPKNKIEQIEIFKNSKDLVMVSPSMDRGVSLNDELCEFQIVVKAAYPDLGNKQTKTRAYGSGEIGKYWYSSMTAQTMMQQCGRGNRHINDKCSIFILDGRAEDLFIKNKDMFDDYFIDSVIDWED